jgi:hypothetical protein
MDINYNGEDVTLDKPNFDKTIGMEKAIVRYKKTYGFMFEGDDDYEEEDMSEEKHIFKVGDKIALIENYDWHKHLSEFAGEIEFTEDSNTYYDNYGSVYIFTGKNYIAFSGEYAPIDDKDKDLINKEFNTNYKVIFST